MKKLLILTSVNEGIHSTKYRRATVNEQPFSLEFQEYIIEYAFLIRKEDHNDEFGKWMSNENKEHKTKRLKSEIEKFKPDYIILHTGIAYFMASEYVICLFRELRTEFPLLQLGIEIRSEISKFGEGIFSDATEIQRAENLISPKNRIAKKLHISLSAEGLAAKIEIEQINFEKSSFEEMCGGNQEFMVQMIDGHSKYIPQIIDLLRCCVEENWNEHASRCAHRIKPCMSNLGAKRLRNLCQQLESAGRTGSRRSDLEPKFIEIEYLTKCLIEKLHSEYDRLLKRISLLE